MTEWPLDGNITHANSPAGPFLLSGPPVDTQFSPGPSQQTLDSFQLGLHTLESSNVTRAGGARADLFCTFHWGVGLRPLVSHPSFLPGLGLAPLFWPKVDDVLRAGNSNGGGSITTTKHLTRLEVTQALWRRQKRTSGFLGPRQDAGPK